MKYLNKYGELVANSWNIKSNIKDMLVELQDDGYGVNVLYMINNDSYIVHVNQNQSLLKRNKSIIEVFNRVIDYMTDLDFSYKIAIVSIDKNSKRIQHIHNEIDTMDDLFKYGIFTTIDITFK